MGGGYISIMTSAQSGDTLVRTSRLFAEKRETYVRRV
jgi:hypothetical protein